MWKRHQTSDDVRPTTPRRVTRQEFLDFTLSMGAPVTWPSDFPRDFRLRFPPVGEKHGRHGGSLEAEKLSLFGKGISIIFDFQSFIFFFWGGGVHVKFQGCNKYLAYMVVVYMG